MRSRRWSARAGWWPPFAAGPRRAKPGAPGDPYRFIRKAASSRLDQAEAQVYKAVRKAMEEQEARVLAKLRSAKARKGTRHWDYGSGWDPLREKKAIDPAKVFNLERETKAFQAAVMPTIRNVFVSFGQDTAESLGVSFNLRDPAVAADILARSNRLAQTTQTTWERVQEAIIDGEAEGESIDGIAKRIRGVMAQATGYRSRMIARTETIGATNAGSYLAAASSGVVDGKVWLAASDARTRASHVTADGQEVPIKGKFRVGASLMEYPGDPAGGAHEVVNCRCSMLYKRAEDAPDTGDLPIPEDIDARAQRVEKAVSDAKAAGEESYLKHQLPGGQPGTYTAARLRQQDEIIREFMASAADVPTDGKAVFSGGLGGAGKGTVLRSAESGIDASEFLTIDPDAIKEAMAAKGMIFTPEGLSPMEMSALVHEESSHIAARLAQEAMAAKKNLIYDITMSSEKSVAARLDLLRRAGYEDVEMIFVDIPVETSVDRALARYADGIDNWLQGEGYGGRYVPPDVIRAQADEVWGSVNRRVFETYKNQATRWKMFENTGAAPRLVASSTEELAGVTRTGVDLAERMPEGLSKQGAMDWFRGKWGRALRYDPVDKNFVEVDRIVNFGTMGKDTLVEYLQTLDEMFSKFPAVADRIPEVGSFSGLKAEGIYIRKGSRVQGMALRRRFLATTSKSGKELVDTAERMKAMGWWSSGNRMGVLHHEFGHHVHYTVEEVLGEIRGDQALIGRAIIQPAFTEASGLEGSWGSFAQTREDAMAGISNHQWCIDNLSKYATTNTYEMCAEAVAEVLGEENPRPFAVAIVRRLEDWLRRMPK